MNRFAVYSEGFFYIRCPCCGLYFWDQEVNSFDLFSFCGYCMEEK